MRLKIEKFIVLVILASLFQGIFMIDCEFESYASVVSINQNSNLLENIIGKHELISQSLGSTDKFELSLLENDKTQQEKINEGKKYFDLGYSHYYGIGRQVDYLLAVQFFEKSAELENPFGIFGLGMCYFYGKGVIENEEKAEEYIRKVKKWILTEANKEDAITQHLIGWMYREGVGVEKDRKEALKWYLKADQQGYAPSQNEIGIMYYYGTGLEKNYNKSLAWTIKAAEKGFVPAQYNIGVMYNHGQGVEKNYEKAVELYKIAAEKGYPLAQFNLAGMYHDGKGMEKNYQKAIELYKKLAQQGHRSSQYWLAHMYSNGKGVETSKEQAAKWYEKASEQGEQFSQAYLAELYFFGIGVEQNYEKAVELYKKSAEQGNIKACEILTLIYSNGLGVEKDEEEAIKWYKKSLKWMKKDMLLDELRPLYTIRNTQDILVSRIRFLFFKPELYDTIGNKYKDGLYVNHTCSADYCQAPVYHKRGYNLDKKYLIFSGILVVNNSDKKNTSNKSSAYIEIYGDGKLLYKSNLIKKGVRPQYFVVDVKDVVEMELVIKADNIKFGIVDAAFYK